MGRVIRISAVVLILFLLGVPIKVNSQESSPDVLLVKWYEPNFGVFDYYLVANHTITPLNEGYNTFAGASADGEWLYFAETQGAGDSSDGTFYLYRISLDVRMREPIVSNADYFEWSPDRRHILYLLGASERNLYQIEPDGSNPTPFIAEEKFSVGNWYWVERLQQFVLNGWQTDVDGNSQNSGIYALDANHQELVSIRPDMGLVAVTLDDQWLIVGDANGLYRMALDGSDLFQFFAIESGSGQQPYLLLKAFLADGSVLIQTGDSAYGSYEVVRLLDGAKLWSFEQAVWLQTERDAEWIYVWYGTDTLYEYSMVMYKSDGTEQRVVENPLPATEKYEWTPDRQWFYVQQDGHLIRARADLSETQNLGLGEFAGWSEDFTQIYMTEYGGQVCYLYRMNLDGTDRVEIAELPIDQFPLSDFGQSIYVVELP